MIENDRTRNVVAAYIHTCQFENNAPTLGFVQLAALPEISGSWPIQPIGIQRFESLVYAQNAFLGRIRHVTVNDLTGEVMYTGIEDSVVARTEIQQGVRREPQIVGSSSKRQYVLADYEADLYRSYQQLDHWAQHGAKQLNTIINQQLAIQTANNLLNIGFNGTSRAATSLRSPETMDIGWLQLIRNEAPSHVITEIEPGSGIVTVGLPRERYLSAASVTDVGGGVVGLGCAKHNLPTGAVIVIEGTTNYNGAHQVLGSSTEDEIHITAAYQAETVQSSAKFLFTPDYLNLSSLISDLKRAIPMHRRGGLEVLLSDDLIGEEERELYDEFGNRPTERSRVPNSLSTIAGLRVNTPHFFPQATVLVTNPMNLSIYKHSVIRRKIEEKEELKGVILWNLWKQSYIVEDYEPLRMAENVVLV